MSSDDMSASKAMRRVLRDAQARGCEVKGGGGAHEGRALINFRNDPAQGVTQFQISQGTDEDTHMSGNFSMMLAKRLRIGKST